MCGELVPCKYEDKTFKFFDHLMIFNIKLYTPVLYGLVRAGRAKGRKRFFTSTARGSTLLEKLLIILMDILIMIACAMCTISNKFATSNLVGLYPCCLRRCFRF